MYVCVHLFVCSRVRAHQRMCVVDVRKRVLHDYLRARKRKCSYFFCKCLGMGMLLCNERMNDIFQAQDF